MASIDAAALLFDLDGVLADSHLAVEHSWRVWANEKGLDADEIIAAAHGRRTVDTLADVIPGVRQQAEVTRLLALEREAIDLVGPVPGAVDFVRSLGDLPWAVATSGAVVIAESRLRKVGIRLPTVLVTAERVRRGKPDPEVYRIAAAELNVDPHACVVFEDAPAGVEAGKRAGASVVALLTTFPAAVLGSADVIVRDFRDIRLERLSAGIRLHCSHQRRRSR